MESDDLFSNLKEKMSQFRLKELKDVLYQLGLSKQGKKQELTDRILASLCHEQDIAPKANGLTRGSVPKKETIISIIDETYRKMQNLETSTSEATPKNNTQNGVKKAKKEKEKGKEKGKENNSSSSSVERKVQCLCGTSLSDDSMIKCDDTQCNIWQHIKCVIIPENSSEWAPPVIPPVFYCELCRIKRADPFWVPVENPLKPMILPPSISGSDGTYVSQCIEKSFQLSKANRETLQKSEFDLQVWCMLLNDKVPFRMQWPLNSDFQVNGIPMRIMSRPNTTQLGNNGRDDGPLITACHKEGTNKIIFSKCDGRTFCFGIRIVRRRSLQEVLALIPKEDEGENYETALARVVKCVGGPTADGDADVSDDDSDIELVSDSFSINLRCPMSGSRMKIAGRFKPCAHMGCFDLETFVELNQRSRKWQCPICLKNYSLESLIIDPYFNRITSLMRNCSEDINEIEVKPDGSWRIKPSNSFNYNNQSKDLLSWHLPGGALLLAPQEFKPHLQNEIIDARPLSKEIQEETIDTKTNIQNIPNIQHNFQPIFRETEETNIIVLSDSDDDDVAVLSPPREMVRGGPGAYAEEEMRGTVGEISCLDLLNNGEEPAEFGLGFWEYDNQNAGQLPAVGELLDGGEMVRGGPGPQENGNNKRVGGPFVDSDAASILQSMNGNQNENPNPNPNEPASRSQSQSQRGGFSTFSPPRQPRSVRPRLVLSIDSDSDE
ncbi:hypothetical protein LUZ60_015349 [Juncus effusus]|nr:hypothetical protein LUZ60_015349 [Juncus effusus]